MQGLQKFNSNKKLIRTNPYGSLWFGVFHIWFGSAFFMYRFRYSFIFQKINRFGLVIVLELG